MMGSVYTLEGSLLLLRYRMGCREAKAEDGTLVRMLWGDLVERILARAWWHSAYLERGYNRICWLIQCGL
jgi:hypothetical protein